MKLVVTLPMIALGLATTATAAVPMQQEEKYARDQDKRQDRNTAIGPGRI